MKHHQVFKLDLTKIEGGGDFACPSCGTMISPEDETENVYVILETKMKKDFLEELIIQCNRCGSRIHLVGFLTPSPSSLK
jgi:DNA-directed RNA polymerase subunit RPC12/RpoP